MLATDGVRSRRGSAVSALTATGACAKPDGENEFLKLIAVDFSSLEPRFEQILARLEALECRLSLQERPKTAEAVETDDSTFDLSVAASGGLSIQEPSGDGESQPTATDSQTVAATDGETEVDAKAEAEAGAEAEADSDDSSGDSAAQQSQSKAQLRPKPYHDALALAQEIESLRAAQLRLKVEQELAHSALGVELQTLRQELALRPQRADLADFRAEMAQTAAVTARELQEECQMLAHTANAALADRQLAENRWKAAFEDTIAARIQDLWSGLHATSRKLQESMQFLQSDVVTQEESAREVAATLEAMRASTQRVEKDSRAQGQQLAEQEKDMVHLHGMCTQAAVRLDEHGNKLRDEIGIIYRQLSSADARTQQQQRKQEAQAKATEKSLAALSSDLSSCHSSLRGHQDALRSLDAASTRHTTELARVAEHLTTADAKTGGIDGRLAFAEKKLAVTETVVEEHFQERQQLVAALQESVNHAALDRAAMKRVTADLGLSLQDTQQGVRDVGKQASTTELALARTAAELGKLQSLAATTSSNVAKNRQSIRDVLAMVEEDRQTAQVLREAVDKEVADSVSRFAAALQRDEDAQSAIADTNHAAERTKQMLEERIRHNGNLIHQLNTMVDSLVITESVEAMEDKLSSFALACAQLALKLEHFSRAAGTVRADVKAELAVLITKIIRFLGAGVAIDQNKYLLTAKRSQAVDPVSGKVVLELPPQQVLDGFRLAKAALFTAKTRAAMDQLQPVARTNRAVLDSRDAFERKLRFVLEFGLANLFPNQGRPKNPDNRRGFELGTCIACDRPIDDDSQHSHQSDDEPPEAVQQRPRELDKVARPSSALPSSAMAEQQRLQRQQSSVGTRPGSAAMGNRIDTKSTVRGRSGASALRPKASSEALHCAPGRAEFVYRGGFRIPKPATSKSNPVVANSASSPSVLYAGVVANIAASEPVQPELSGSGGVIGPGSLVPGESGAAGSPSDCGSTNSGSCGLEQHYHPTAYGAFAHEILTPVGVPEST